MHFSCWNPTAIALNVGRPVDVYFVALVNNAIDGRWFAALLTVESEIPFLAAVCAAPNTSDTHVYHSQESARLQLGEITYLRSRGND